MIRVADPESDEAQNIISYQKLIKFEEKSGKDLVYWVKYLSNHGQKHLHRRDWANLSFLEKYNLDVTVTFILAAITFGGASYMKLKFRANRF